MKAVQVTVMMPEGARCCEFLNHADGGYYTGRCQFLTADKVDWTATCSLLKQKVSRSVKLPACPANKESEING